MEQAERSIEEIEQEVFDAAMVIARFGVSKCLAQANGNVSKALALAQTYGTEVGTSVLGLVQAYIEFIDAEATARIEAAVKCQPTSTNVH